MAQDISRSACISPIDLLMYEKAFIDPIFR